MADGDYDLWDTLNLQPGASVDEVRVAFRELSRLYHPDKHAAGGEGENAAFVRVHRAYRILSDEALRGFYEKYGLSGVRLAENLSDDEGAARGEGLSVPDDRLKDLEVRVQRLVRKHEELRAQRLLSLNGSFLLSVAATAKPGTPLKRRFRLQYTALSHSVQIHLSERFRLSVGCASHVQSSSGAGAAKLMLAASTTVAPGTNIRASCNVTGSSADAELSVVRSLSPHCTVRQQLGFSRDGRYLALNFSPWLTRTLRGGLTGTFSSDPSLSLNLVKTSLSCGHSAKMFVELQPGAGELGCTFKYKPVKGFSMKVSPTLSRQGAALQFICTKASADALTKLHWALHVRAHGLALRLTFYRCGLRFVLPLELWSEASGPVPATELGLAVLFWAAPPFLLRLLHTGIGLVSKQISKVWAAPKSNTPKASCTEDAQQAENGHQRAFLAGEAARRRKDEEDINGLVILAAHYGPGSALQNGMSNQGLSQARGVIDVTNCLMAKVRDSRLQISSAPKSTLLGFGQCQEDSADPVLHIRYRFGGNVFSRSFGERDVAEMGEQFRWNPSAERMGQMLLQAVYMEDQVTLEHLIKQKANLEARDETGATALHIATTRNMPSTVSWLLRHRADCFAKDGDGYHALTWACIKGHLQIVKILLEARASIEEAASSSGKTPLSLAAERGHKEVVEELLAKQARLDQTNTDGSTPLHAAAHQCEVEIVAHLLSRKSIVNVADNEGWTPLMYAVNSPTSARDSVRPELNERKVHIEGAIGKKSTLELLLLHKADANVQSVEGLSPLIIVCAYDRPHAVKQLLDAKAQVNMATAKGQSAMLMAAVNDLPGVAKALIVGNADVNQANGKGESPLSVSEKNGFREVADLLKSAGALPPKGGKKKGRK
ncbi:unnamed protein product [Symbiodinium pilosum]|uniref:J domain-containing protein n=1 Tax=Symbiodinium pilosum TaxID=2952 RepID=A0A812WB94_SYMPI|nr:unnamed protein product [Symbiodinium pilosum]